jgi:hypothetical protein
MPSLAATLVPLLAAAKDAEDVKPLSGTSILVVLALIVVIVAAILLAGFGYFGPSDGKD